jgi:hypothetical protein
VVVSRQDVSRPTVLCHPQDARPVDVALTALWRQVEARGWFPAGGTRVVIQAGSRGRSAIVLATARSLAERLAVTNPITIVDLGAGAEDWPGFERRDPLAEESLRVSSPFVPGGVAVPVLWLEPHVLVTVAGVVPAPMDRLAAGLAAQAEVLRRLNPAAEPSVLGFEAHRLAASDLVVCGHAQRAGEGAWWVVGASDVGVELALAEAAALAPARLPALRELARHELLPAGLTLVGRLPALAGEVGPAWRSRLHRAGARLRSTRRAIAHDVRMLRRNLTRIPGFVRRRLARAARSTA